jgi:serine/threonine protein kinase
MLRAGMTIGPYSIERRVGQGGMASVFLARDTRLDRPVAVKAMPDSLREDPVMLQRFEHEARAVARLRHPNIVSVYDVIQTDEVDAIVMEYIAGSTLRDKLGRRFSLDEVLDVLDPIADALDYAHRQGLIHRDVKPSNILFTADGSPVLSDFGLVRPSDQENGLTATATAIGTPEYISPEQALGQTVTKATDIFSLTVIAYEMICGAQPYQADTPVAMLVAHAHTPPRSPRQLYPGIPPALEAALMKGLSRYPAERYNSALDLVDALASDAIQTTLMIPDSVMAGQTGQNESKDIVEGSEEIPVRQGASGGVIALRIVRVLIGLLIIGSIAVAALPGLNSTPRSRPNMEDLEVPASSARSTSTAASTPAAEGTVVNRRFSAAPEMTIDPNKRYFATISTERGDVKLELFPKEAPKTVNSFVFLAGQGFFDNLTWHRVLPNFVAQTGDPTGTGSGGPGYTVPDEINSRKFGVGTLGMANAGPNTNGSQFFITYAPQPNLDGRYTVFGQVISGQDVLQKITPRDPSTQRNAPVGDKLLKVTIETEGP